jgi:hypothetical protein
MVYNSSCPTTNVPGFTEKYPNKPVIFQTSLTELPGEIQNVSADFDEI